jgi:hypothetical protein
MLNPYYAIDGMRLLRDKVSPAEIVARMTGSDPGAHVRQLHIVDIAGRIAQHTGKQCIDWAGHIAGAEFSVAGNMLAGPQVIQKTAERFAATKGQPMAERLLRALEAGGRQAATSAASSRRSRSTGEPYAGRDIHRRSPTLVGPPPLRQSKERWAIFRRFLPTKLNPAGHQPRGDRRRHRQGGQPGAMTDGRSSPLPRFPRRPHERALEVRDLRPISRPTKGSTGRSTASAPRTNRAAH